MKCVYWKASVGLKCVRTSRMDSFLNFLPLYTDLSREVISAAKISAVNFMVVLNQSMLENLMKMKFHDLKQIIRESRISQAINHVSLTFRYSRITFLFK